MDTITGRSWSLSFGTEPTLMGCGWVWPVGERGRFVLPLQSMEQLAGHLYKETYCFGAVDPGVEELTASLVLLGALLRDRPALFSAPIGRGEPLEESELFYPCYLATGEELLLGGWQGEPVPTDAHAPVSRAALFSFGLRLVYGFLPRDTLCAVRDVGDTLYTGWPAAPLQGYLGNADTWIPICFTSETLEVTGDPMTKESLSQQMPVDIIVEVGRLVLRGEELDSLTPGAVLPLGGSPKGQVNLVHDGRVVARGELLVAGDELAIKIVS